MVKSPWQREENGSQSPCQIEHAMGMKESHPGSPSEDYFDITEQHAQLDEGHIKTEPHDEQCMDFERDPFDELAELLEEENVPVYLVDMPLEAPPPPSISLSDDCFLFTRRSKVEIASPVASSPASISETLALDSPKKSETALEPIDEAHVQSKSRLHSRRSCGSPPWHPSRRRRSRSGSTKKRQCSPIRSAPRLRNDHKGDRTTCSRDGAHRKSSSMETKRCNKSRAKSPGQIRRERVPRKSTTRISADTNRNRTRSPNRTSSNDREQFRKQMSYNRLSRRKFEEHWNAFGRRRSRSGSSNRRPLRRDSLSPIRSPHRGRREFPRYIRRYSPKRLSRPMSFPGAHQKPLKK
ncbi:splicing regulatory glutamine/lysine-rich protein 1 [Drosophila obscura]|uniref:splicing regulatory glutamine/lysine-rich protein 1 n=1 Tax=Drosophila obscura TaxID=7282 RepID=UPI001BB1D0A8|nr:splicing regulatory glutamine/lysine-rich protein 1 [Drosophila obscura]